MLLNMVTGYINAGGRGTRLEPILEKHSRLGITKALLPFNGATLVDYQIKRMMLMGLSKIVIAAGDHYHLAQYLCARYAHVPSVEVVTDEKQCGTGGDLIQCYRQGVVKTPTLLIVNVDTLLHVPELSVLAFHAQHGGGATIVLTRKPNVPNFGAWTKLRGDHRIVYSRESSELFHNETPVNPKAVEYLSSTGMTVLNSALLEHFYWDTSKGPLSLYRDILGWCVQQMILFGYDNQKNLFLDVGTPSTFRSLQRHPSLERILLSRASNQLINTQFVGTN